MFSQSHRADGIWVSDCFARLHTFLRPLPLADAQALDQRDQQDFTQQRRARVA